MSDFSNFYNATVDDKGRIVLPAPYKREIVCEPDCQIVIEIDPYEKCLNLYPNTSWTKRVDFIKSRLNPNDQRQSRLLDKFYQSFVRVVISDNGRINIPNPFLQRMNIVKDAVFSGQGDRIRLWSCEEYNKAMLPDDEYPSLFNEFLGGNVSL